MAKKIYIAGPMRGHKEFNFPAFFAAEEAIRAAAALELEPEELIIYNPARKDEKQGFPWRGLDGTEEDLEREGFDYPRAMADACDFICMSADRVHMLPGWCRSPGATAERSLAVALKLEITGAPF